MAATAQSRKVKKTWFLFLFPPVLTNVPENGLCPSFLLAPVPPCPIGWFCVSSSHLL